MVESAVLDQEEKSKSEPRAYAGKANVFGHRAGQKSQISSRMVRQLRTPASSLFQKSRQDDADTPVSPASASQKPKSGWGDYELGTNSAIVDLRLRLASDSESRKSIGFGERIGEKIGEVLPGFRYSAGALRFVPCLMEESGRIEEK